MGQDVESRQFTGADRQRYRAKIRRCLDVFSRMLTEARFDVTRPMTGLEIEFNLVDENRDPAMRNAEVLNAIADPAFQTEVGQYNIEINVPPRPIGDTNTDELEKQVRASLNQAEAHSRSIGTHIVMIGILPTVGPEHVTRESLSANPRYSVLNQQIVDARGEDMSIDIVGVERLRTHADSIAPESACTSLQCHLQVSPQQYASFWNAAQCIAGVQVALGANSPFFFGKELWRETRIGLFEQATDTRPEELKAQGVRPRVWFGERWITSIFDQFEENVRYFPSLLPICDDEDPVEVLERGDTPSLPELRIHNGTIYRWNRPVYDVVRGVPHVRVENRVLPAGPTVVDVLANAMFWYGLVHALSAEDRPLWSRMSFPTAEENFGASARAGIDAHVYWPGVGEVPVTELTLRRLLPMARAGLDGWGVASSVSDRLLGIIEGRCKTGVNGAEWQARMFHRISEQHRSMDRRDVLRTVLSRYIELMHSNEPVHTWPLD